MEKYFVFARVDDIDYMTTVTAESAYAAEHTILDLSVCTRHYYGVDACIAFDASNMKTDSFVGCALRAYPVSFDELYSIIDKHNAHIIAQQEAEDRIHQIEKQMQQLAAELEEAKKVLAA